MGKIVRTISADASVVASAIDATDIVAEIERYSCPVEESVKESIDYLLDAPFVKASYRK